MVQEFNVLSCFSCRTFQVDQVKKSTNKWTCKLCGEKQSIKQIFFKGSGKECRMQVQQLNLAKGMKNQVESANAHYVGDERQQTQIRDYLENELPQYPELKQDIALDMFEEKSKPMASSRWEQFVEIQEDQSDDEKDKHSSMNFTTERFSFEESRRMMKRQRHESQRGNKCKPYQQRRPQQDTYERNTIQNCSTTVKRKHGADIAGQEISQSPVDRNQERSSIDKEQPNLRKSHTAGSQHKQYSKAFIERAQTRGKGGTEIDIIPRAAQSSRWDQFMSANLEEDCSDNEENL